jgi:hypothetical protein
MEQDIHKLADWLETVTREGIAIERKILQWKCDEERAQPEPIDKEQLAKAS